jgi:hypothetical protein
MSTNKMDMVDIITRVLESQGIERLMDAVGNVAREPKSAHGAVAAMAPRSRLVKSLAGY